MYYLFVISYNYFHGSTALYCVIIIIIIIISGTLLVAPCFEPMATECKEHTIHTTKLLGGCLSCVKHVYNNSYCTIFQV